MRVALKDEDREVHTEDIELYSRMDAIDKILRVEGLYQNPEQDLGKVEIVVKYADSGNHPSETT